MLRKVLRRYRIVVQWVVLLIGALLTLVSTLFHGAGTPNVALLSLGLAIVASSIVSLLDSLFGTDLSSILDTQLQIDETVRDSGLTRIHAKAGSESAYQKFNHARQIDLLFNTGKNTFHHQANGIADAIAAHNCQVRILISDSASAVWKSDEVRKALCPGTDVVNELQEVHDRIELLIERVQGRLGHGKGGSIEVRTYQSAPTGSIILIDKEFAQYTPYLPYSHSSEVPIYEFERRGRDGGVFEALASTFEAMWSKHAQSILIARAFNS